MNISTNALTTPGSLTQPETRKGAIHITPSPPGGEGRGEVAQPANWGAPRLPGGQPRNQNARKHGFYANYLTPKEARVYEEAARISGTMPEITLLRCKLAQMLGQESVDVALLARISELINRLELNRVEINGKNDPANPIARQLVGWMLEMEAQPPGNIIGDSIREMRASVEDSL